MAAGGGASAPSAPRVGWDPQEGRGRAGERGAERSRDGAERSGSGRGQERRGAGDPARGAGASGLLRWLSPARSCGFPRVESPMEAEAADGPPGGAEAALSCFSFNQDCT